MKMYLCVTSLHSSTSIKKRSNLDMMGADMLTFCFRDLARLYLPSMGLAAARMDVRAFRVAYSIKIQRVDWYTTDEIENILTCFIKRTRTFTPAFVMEMVCCSMASCMATWSLRSILSNSSIQQTPYKNTFNLTSEESCCFFVMFSK